jgi:gas vesicle protein
MGYDGRDEEAGAMTKLTYLIIGGGIGAILALLFAPKSGQELREDIADVTRKGLEKSRETAGQLGEYAGEYYEVAKDKTGELYQTAQEKAEALAQGARDVASRTASPFTAAIDAGKKAYMDEKRRTESELPAERPTYPVKDDSADNN